MKVLILAGGLGTRLKSIVSDKPKPMADIQGKPFLEYLINKLVSEGFTDIILAVGYKYEIIQEYFKRGENHKCNIEYVIEEQPLGTGGAIANSKQIIKDDVIILNGDTYFDIDYKEFVERHKMLNSKFTIALRRMENAERYGAVEFDDCCKITAFVEKGNKSDSIYINGGIYIVNKEIIGLIEEGKSCSLEKDIIPLIMMNYEIYGYKSDSYFIDIGIPEDYKRFCKYIEEESMNDN